VITLLGALGLAAKVDPPLRPLLKLFEKKQARVANESKRKKDLAARKEKEDLAAKEKERKEKEDLLTDTATLAAKANALAAETKAWEAEVEQGVLII
jgi:hypothetical protein